MLPSHKRLKLFRVTMRPNGEVGCQHNKSIYSSSCGRYDQNSVLLGTKRYAAVNMACIHASGRKGQTPRESMGGMTSLIYSSCTLSLRVTNSMLTYIFH